MLRCSQAVPEATQSLPSRVPSSPKMGAWSKMQSQLQGAHCYEGGNMKLQERS